MKKFILLLVVLFTGTLVRAQDSLIIRKIYDEALVKGEAYER